MDRPIAEGQSVDGNHIDHRKKHEQAEILREARLGKHIARNLRDKQAEAYGCEDGKVLDHAFFLLLIVIILTLFN
jgi:hypothetical protein